MIQRRIRPSEAWRFREFLHAGTSRHDVHALAPRTLLEIIAILGLVGERDCILMSILFLNGPADAFIQSDFVNFLSIHI